MLLMQHVLKEPCKNYKKFIKTIDQTIMQIQCLDKNDFYCFVLCYYQPDKLVTLLINSNENEITNFKSVNLFLKKFYEFSFSYFQKEKDPFIWMNDDPDIKELKLETKKIVMQVSHSHMDQLATRLQEIIESHSIESKELTVKLLEIPGYMDLVNRFKSIPQKLFSRNRE